MLVSRVGESKRERRTGVTKREVEAAEKTRSGSVLGNVLPENDRSYGNNERGRNTASPTAATLL